MMRGPVYIIDGLRTAIGSPYRGLKDFTISQMAAFVIEEIIRRHKIKKSLIDFKKNGHADGPPINDVCSKT